MSGPAGQDFLAGCLGWAVLASFTHAGKAPWPQRHLAPLERQVSMPAIQQNPRDAMPGTDPTWLPIPIIGLPWLHHNPLPSTSDGPMSFCKGVLASGRALCLEEACLVSGPSRAIHWTFQVLGGSPQGRQILRDFNSENNRLCCAPKPCVLRAIRH